MPGTPASMRSIESRLFRSPFTAFVLAVALTTQAGGEALAGEPPPRPIDFNREIRPILSNACFTCHGPDAAKRKGVSKPLRLDNEAGAFADLGGYAAIVRGNPEESELIQRLISDDPTERMPPKGSGNRSPQGCGTADRVGAAGGLLMPSTGRTPSRSGHRCPRSRTPPGRATPLTTLSSPDWNRSRFGPSPRPIGTP